MSRRKLPELFTEVVEVTPEIAAEWLKKNTFNRKKSDRLVDFYAEEMISDEWRLNGEPIIFDSKGRLQSGQHRLWACIEAETSFWTLVVTGTDPDAIYTLDTGRKRSMGDALTLRGEKDVAVLGSMLTWTWRWENKVMGQGNKTRTSNVTLLKMLDQRPDIREALHYAYRFRKGFKAPVALLAALWYQFAQIDETDALFFLEQCVTGENLSAEDPAYAWRRWISSRYLESSKPNQQTIAAVTTKAWNALRRHETVRAFRWAGNENFPEAI